LNWKTLLREDLLQWLLAGEPWIAYRTLTDLLDKNEKDRAGHDSQIETGWEKLKYPFTDYKILKFLDVLSQFEHAKKRLGESEMVNLLLSKRDENGRFTPESIHKVWSDFDFGQKEKPSKWITLLALRVVKRISS